MGVKVRINSETGRKGQVTIFIIIAILIVVAIIAFFVLFGKMSSETPKQETPRTYIEKCAKGAVSESVEKVFAGGGRVEPDFFIMYKSLKYNYLCYQRNWYLPCINYYPQLKNIIEQEIKQDTIDSVKECFDDLKDEYEQKGYTISDGGLTYEIELATKQVLIKIDKSFDISKSGSSQSFKKFDTIILSPLFDLAMVAREIVNQESEFCNFEYNGFMLFYPEYDIKRIDYDDSKIYKLFDRQSGKEFKFAVRSCAFAPGI